MLAQREAIDSLPVPDSKPGARYTGKMPESPARRPIAFEKSPAPKSPINIPSEGISGPEQRILNAIAWLESLGIEKPEQTAVAFLAGYTYGGGGFNNPRGALRTKGLLEYHGNRIALTDSGRSVAATPDTPLTTEELHAKVLAILPGTEQKLLRVLLEIFRKRSRKTSSPSEVDTRRVREASIILAVD